MVKNICYIEDCSNLFWEITSALNNPHQPGFSQEIALCKHHSDPPDTMEFVWDMSGRLYAFDRCE